MQIDRFPRGPAVCCWSCIRYGEIFTRLSHIYTRSLARVCVRGARRATTDVLVSVLFCNDRNDTRRRFRTDSAKPVKTGKKSLFARTVFFPPSPSRATTTTTTPVLSEKNRNESLVRVRLSLRAGGQKKKNPGKIEFLKIRRFFYPLARAVFVPPGVLDTTNSTILMKITQKKKKNKK